RPEPKKHGRQNQIEGQLDKGQRVVVIEDLISTGKSSLNAVSALRDAGADVLSMYALFTYGFPVADTAFEDAQLSLKTLCDYEHLLTTALHQNSIEEEQLKSLQLWRKDPANWTP
ncbi:MAG: orotate phosphoribosyltransferase, partial [Flavobacteriaceae bacterium]